MRTTVDAVAEFLAVMGIRRMYGVPGAGSSLDLIEAIRRRGIEFVSTHHPGAAILMAATDGDLSDRPGVCVIPQGSGLAGAVSGLALAHLDRLPLIAFSECPPRAGRRAGIGRVLNHPQILRGVTKDGATVTSTRAERLIAWAWEKAAAAPAGPVFLELPADEALLPARRRALSLPKHKPAGPSPNAIRRIARLLIRAGRAVVVAGMSCRDEMVARALRDLVEHLGSPVFTTQRAKGVIPEDHPLAAGVCAGGRLEERFLGRAECVLAVGLDSAEVLPRPWRPGPTILSIVACQENTLPHEVDAEAAGDLATALVRLQEELPPAGEWQFADWAKQGERFHARMRSLLAETGGIRGSQWVAPHRVVEIAREVFPRPTMAVADAGAHALAVAAFWEAYEPKGYLCPSSPGGTGYALPVAIAAKLVAPDRPVVAFMGEGGFLLNLAEVATAGRLGVPLAIVVFLDGALSWVRVAQEQKRYAPVGASLEPMDIPKLAESLGVFATVVEDEEELRTALQEATETTRPAIVAVRVNPHGYNRMVEILRGKANR
jgi:acetolactate synthase I/II/III large subunit